MAQSIRDLLKKRPSPNSISQKCERLAALEDELQGILEEFTPRAQQLEDDIESATGSLNDQIGLLEKEIKRDCLALEQTIDTPTHQVQYVKGRQTWDSRGLKGYMAADHPELKEFLKEGNPTVKIKKLEKDEDEK